MTPSEALILKVYRELLSGKKFDPNLSAVATSERCGVPFERVCDVARRGAKQKIDDWVAGK